MSDEKYLIDRLVAIARENERLVLQLEDVEDNHLDMCAKLEEAKDKIAMLESVKLLQELKEIENAPDIKNGI